VLRLNGPIAPPRGLRDRGARLRQRSAQLRVDAAAARDAAAHARDLAALERDRAAALLDRELAERDAARTDDGRLLTGVEIVLHAAEDRRRAAAYRAAATEARARAAADRQRAALDRELAAHDRLHAQADRDALVRQVALAETDALTGARTRAAGLLDLDHEIDRSHRTADPLVVAYIDVVGLKAVNDTRGHAAGDELLQRAVHAVRDHLRAYDLIVRLGGDEFLCAMPGAMLEDARRRFATIQTTLATGPVSGEITVGFAVLRPQDSAAELIGHADAALRASRARIRNQHVWDPDRGPLPLADPGSSTSRASA
jgi:diguanylate cyclase (GGDEF)-like protein